MTALPDRSIMEGPSGPTNAQGRVWFLGVRDYLNGLFGATGDAYDARIALDVYSKSESDGVAPSYVGATLQTVTGADGGSSTTSTSLVNVSGSVVTITPKSASSKLLITCIFQGSSAAFAGANTVASFRIFENTTALGTGEMTIGASTASGGTGSSSVTTVQAVVTNTAIAARSFKLHAKTSNASSSAAAVLQNWTITEIKT